MSRNAKKRVFVGDFETTVFEGQIFTEVWASALVELGTEDVHVHSSIAYQWDEILRMKSNCLIYYHNLKFDGEFWLNYLLGEEEYKQAFVVTDEESGDGHFLENKEMPNRSLKYSISAMGQWYSITVKINNKIIEFRDSLKLLPFSVKKIGKSFKTKHQKLEMEYEGFRYAGCEITEEERHYIANDVLVVKEALELMFQEGHTRLTIGSCCLAEYKEIVGKYNFRDMFPELTEYQDEYIRKAYKGGWCYVVDGKQNAMKYGGSTYDVNSLYPSMMHSESGNRYPIGHPHFFSERIPDFCFSDDIYFFIRVKTRFYIKPNKLPFIQIKGSFLYSGNECLKTSDIYDSKTGTYVSKYEDYDGWHEAIPELTLTQTDYALLKDHYDLEDFEIISGCWFHTEIGIFDEYIDKYKKIKTTSKGARREQAKLFLNNLYGKMATGRDSSFKVVFMKEDGSLGYRTVCEMNKEAVYIPVGAAITSYARNFTIRAAQANYYGVDKPGFCYADTDSIHCDLPSDKVKGIKFHPTDFCCWKHETDWDFAVFVRQKTYIEHVVQEDGEPCEPYYLVKCAGMPQSCKDLFVMSMTQDYDEKEIEEKYDNEKIKFIKTKRTIEDFKVGLVVPGKLMPKHIRGGVLLVEGDYEMRPALPKGF